MRGVDEPIPAARVALEHQLISALDAGPEAITETLHSFRWRDHRELACLGLAEVARHQSGQGAAAVALMAAPFCRRCHGAYCRDCPVQAARQPPAAAA